MKGASAPDSLGLKEEDRQGDETFTCTLALLVRYL